ncbi:MAG: Spy/CpxP family protein refolding chaperone [Deltaproteobacteria bacterium]|nr:Spy/CpxP family protein refolding chaperone [Deltaproteobacteria bacterium]
MKRLAIVAAILALAAIIVVPAMADGPRWGARGRMMSQAWGPGNRPAFGGYAGAYGNLTDEQRKQLEDLSRKFYDETAQIRNQLWTKRGELNILLNGSEPDESKAMTLQKEISELRAKLADARIRYALEARKIAPDARPGWGGYGMGARGHHMWNFGPGQGRMWGGHGPGRSWN